MVWAIVARTAGPTYAKAGAQLLIAPDGRYAGLLSGGCLEGDLAEHARAVLGSGAARLVSYDMRPTLGVNGRPDSALRTAPSVNG
jgi:xanthine/CO dehydrogenase XdhC/CoxF family maturation factor